LVGKILIPSIPFSSFAKAAKLEKGMPLLTLESPLSCQRHPSPKSGFDDCGVELRFAKFRPGVRIFPLFASFEKFALREKYDIFNVTM
jgi:hypothetical protein